MKSRETPTSLAVVVNENRRLRTITGIALIISIASLFLHSCDSDGRGFSFLGGTHVGESGRAGDVGPRGPAGVAGSPGEVGATGENGSRGIMGPRGRTGPSGRNGLDGVNGRNGIDGAPGTQGPQGEIGLRGPAGEIGPEGPSGLSGAGDSGYFWDTTTQGDDGPGGYEANTPYAMRLNNSDVLNNQGISVVDDSHISFTNPGVYNLAFSAQVLRSQGGSTSNMSIWLRKNGQDVPDSSTDFFLQGNLARYVAAWNFFVPVVCATHCDYYELMWSAESEHTSLVYVPPQTLPSRPAIPSLIVTVNQVK